MNSVKLLLTFVIFSQFSNQGTASFADSSGDYPDYSSDNAGYSGDHADYSGDQADYSGDYADYSGAWCSKWWEFSCPSNKNNPCIDGDKLCDGRQNNQCENFCAAPKTDFPLYDKPGECKRKIDFSGLFKYCGQRKGSKHVNNQCYYEFLEDVSYKLRYRCLNRNDIKERVVAGLKTFRDAVKRVNFFDYFRDHNYTHIKCGSNSLSKNIDCAIFFGRKQAIKEYVLLE